MRVLVTGHRGYVGSVLTCVLRNARFDVYGLDSHLFRDGTFGRMAQDIPAFDSDIRDIRFADLAPFDAIVHLAAYPEPADDPDLARHVARINRESTMLLAEYARQAGVRRFIYASTAAVYGRHQSEVFEETARPQPSGPTADNCLFCENALLRMANETFSPTVLRIGDVYGMSPGLRLDRPVNDMVGAAVAHGRISMPFGQAGWRSLIHVEDLSRMIVGVLKASHNAVHGRIFNAARTDEHYRIIEIADMIMQMMPMVTRAIATDPIDPESVRINAGAFARTFSEFRFRWKLVLGIRQLQSAFASAGLTPVDWRCDRFRRAPRLKTLLNQGDVDRTLRMTTSRKKPAPPVVTTHNREPVIGAG